MTLFLLNRPPASRPLWSNGHHFHLIFQWFSIPYITRLKPMIDYCGNMNKQDSKFVGFDHVKKIRNCQHPEKHDIEASGQWRVSWSHDTCDQKDFIVHAAVWRRRAIPTQRLAFINSSFYISCWSSQTSAFFPLEVIGCDSSICKGRHKVLSVFWRN